MSSLHQQEKSQLGRKIVRCGWKARNRLFICALSHKTTPKLDFEPNQHDLSRKRQSLKSPVNDVRSSACSAIFHIYCSMPELSTRRKRYENEKKWWKVRWGVKLTMNCVTACLKQANTKNDSTHEIVDGENVYSDINSKRKENAAWFLCYLNIFLHCLSRVDTRP